MTTEPAIALSAREAFALIEKKEVTAAELFALCRRRIESLEPKLHAFITVCPEPAGDLRAGSIPIPIAIKDNICTAGVRTTCGSRILHDFVSPYHATVVERLVDQGVPILGKTNLDEFAMGSSTENSAFGPTHNPWDQARVPGGSSGGSAAAVASGEAFWALGSDTGGSIRQPAAFCGVVGVNPTYGRVSRYGLVAFASSLDQIGPITKTVEDAAWLLSLISGHDPRDPTSHPEARADFLANLKRPPEGFRVGLVRNLTDLAAPEIREVVTSAGRLLEQSGLAVEEMELPYTEAALACYYLIAPAECASNLARYDGTHYGLRVTREGMLATETATRSEGFGPEAKRRIMLGTYALSRGYYDAFYLKAQKIRTLIRRAFSAAFERYDVLLSPTTPTLPFRLGERLQDPVAMYKSDLCTLPVNLAGRCALSLPAGVAGNLPVGVQLIADAYQEEKMFRAAFQLEQGLDLSLYRRPPPND